MKKKAFIFIFISTHIVFVFLQIHNYSQIIKAHYQKQKNETEKLVLVQKKQELTHHLYALQNKAKVKEFAIAQLHMEPVSLDQIKTLTHQVQCT